MNTIGGGFPLEDGSRLKTGIARVVGGERSRRQAGSPGGSLRTWCKPKAARCVLTNTGVGCVQREGRSNAGGAADISQLLCGRASLQDVDNEVKKRGKQLTNTFIFNSCNTIIKDKIFSWVKSL